MDLMSNPHLLARLVLATKSVTCTNRLLWKKLYGKRNKKKKQFSFRHQRAKRFTNIFIVDEPVWIFFSTCVMLSKIYSFFIRKKRTQIWFNLLVCEAWTLFASLLVVFSQMFDIVREISIVSPPWRFHFTISDEELISRSWVTSIVIDRLKIIKEALGLSGGLYLFTSNLLVLPRK